MAAKAREAVAAADNETYSFQEVFELLRANLAGVTPQQLNEAAVCGLIEQLAGKVSVVGKAASTTDGGAGNTLVTSAVFERHYGYVRVPRMAAGIGQEFQAAYERLQATNTLKGVILDLRFAAGQDYAGAVALADRFLADEQPLVDWGEGWKKSTAKTNAVTLPVAILVNRKTTGAAEALAGVLRHRQVGLLIGTNTAGQASVSKEFALKTGQRLRLAVAPLKVAGGVELPFTGIKPDIQVDVDPEDERVWYEDAYRESPRSARVAILGTNEAPATSTNRAPRRRLNEAELVRLSREGQLPERENPFTNSPAHAAEPQPAVIQDPVLARAVDLLKGLAVVQQFRSL
jgi:C-terminal processing protease CtpA/Prc